MDPVGLMAWAVLLSGYEKPTEMPELVYVTHEFFIDNVCGGKNCKVQGWYNDQGIVYIADYLEDSGYMASVIVHEFTHYLQDMSGLYDTGSCRDALYREREAYGVQNAYLVDGLARFQRIQPGPARCAK